MAHVVICSRNSSTARRTAWKWRYFHHYYHWWSPTVNIKELFKPVLDMMPSWRCTYPHLGLHIQQGRTALPDNQDPASDTESQEPDRVHSWVVFLTCLLRHNLLEFQQMSSIHRQAEIRKVMTWMNHLQHCSNNNTDDRVYSMPINLWH